MSVRIGRTTRKRAEAGYGLLLVVFLTTVLLILSVAVAPSVITQGKREKEKDMIWRGRQYARGVKLYYRKLGRFPTSIDDLTKPKIGSLRFMRQAYKDPMNQQDGTWRFLYVGPAGQIVGSLKPASQNILFPQANAPGASANPVGGFGSPTASGPLGQLGGQPGSGGTSFGTNTPGTITSGTNPSGSNALAQNLPGATGTPVSTDQTDSNGNPQPIPTGDTPTIVGGNIIGVGSKIDKPSIIVYDHAKNYRLFEFIWDPSKDNFNIGGQAGLQTGTGLGQIPGQSPIGQPIGQPVGQPTGQNPQNPQSPANPPQTPPQNPQQ